MSLSEREELFIVKMESSGKYIFNSVEAQDFWKTPQKTANALSRLAHKGWLERLSRGIYLITTIEDRIHHSSGARDYLIGSHLIDDSAIAYGSAIEFYQNELNPGIMYIQTLHRKQGLTIHQKLYHFITIQPDAFIDIEKIRDKTGGFIRVTTREKTLLDCLAHPEYSHSIHSLVSFMQEKHDQINWNRIDELIQVCMKGSTVKRLGYLVEKFDLPIPKRDQHFQYWKNHLTQGITMLDSSRARKGRIFTSWRIEDNVFDRIA